jgi:hypothetical protein
MPEWLIFVNGAAIGAMFTVWILLLLSLANGQRAAAAAARPEREARR